MSIVKKILGEAAGHDTMTAGELIAELQAFDAATPVYFGYDYHDHWHTEVAGSISKVEQKKVEHSDYHDMMKVVDDRDRDDDYDMGNNPLKVGSYVIINDETHDGETGILQSSPSAPVAVVKLHGGGEIEVPFDSISLDPGEQDQDTGGAVVLS
jgi:hypothetical protein